MSELTDNVTLLNIAKASAATGDIFIPANTTFTIDPNGNGDFETIKEAFAFLNGKYSNGNIILNLVDGTHTTTISNNAILDGNNFNIPRILLTGSDKQNCNINILDDGNNDCYAFTIHNCTITVQNISFILNRVNNLSHIFSVNVNISRRKPCVLHINDCDFNGMSRLVWTDSLGKTIFTGTVNVTNSNENCIIAQAGEIDINYATMNCSNLSAGNMFFVNSGGIIKFNYAKLNTNNVNSTFSTSNFNYWDSRGVGYIGGILT